MTNGRFFMPRRRHSHQSNYIVGQTRRNRSLHNTKEFTFELLLLFLFWKQICKIKPVSSPYSKTRTTVTFYQNTWWRRSSLNWSSVGKTGDPICCQTWNGLPWPLSSLYTTKTESSFNGKFTVVTFTLEMEVLPDVSLLLYSIAANSQSLMLEKYRGLRTDAITPKSLSLFPGVTRLLICWSPRSASSPITPRTGFLTNSTLRGCEWFIWNLANSVRWRKNDGG